MTIETLRVELGARGYDIRIGAGLLARAGAEIAPLLARPRVWVVADRAVAARHWATLEAGLAAEGIAALR
ncbi:MAG: 3-dehydroquinate synthase, partial [Rhodosalinus sp.]